MPAIVLISPGFNSRSRVGSDAAAGGIPLDVGVSIRAPAWGATRIAAAEKRGAQFQFALPRGERRKPALFATQNGKFQFALPRGERRSAQYSLISKPGFNSRSRVGSDLIFCICSSNQRGFNSRSRVGSDGGNQSGGQGGTGFNSRSRVGSDAQLPGNTNLQPRVSIRAPAWGATAITG